MFRVKNITLTMPVSSNVLDVKAVKNQNNAKTSIQRHHIRSENTYFNTDSHVSFCESFERKFYLEGELKKNHLQIMLNVEGHD